MSNPPPSQGIHPILRIVYSNTSTVPANSQKTPSKIMEGGTLTGVTPKPEQPKLVTTQGNQILIMILIYEAFVLPLLKS